MNIKECPFCGKAANCTVSDMVNPSCNCFNKIINSLSGKFIQLDVWQSRPYVDVLERKIAAMESAQKFEYRYEKNQEKIWEVLNGRPFLEMREQARSRERKEYLKRELSKLENIR